VKIPRVFGTALKGLTTLVGGVLTAGGVGSAVASGDSQLATCMSYILSQPEGVVTMLGAVFVLFGFGRKAGWMGATSKTAGK
jgi:hypothetical protein